MSAYRELGYGVLFFLCAMAGASLAYLSIDPDPYHNYRHAMPLEPVRDTAVTVALGAIAGGLGWLIYKRMSLNQTVRK
jgi:H+/Cl- antiporter ClcA